MCARVYPLHGRLDDVGIKLCFKNKCWIDFDSPWRVIKRINVRFSEHKTFTTENDVENYSRKSDQRPKHITDPAADDVRIFSQNKNK